MKPLGLEGAGVRSRRGDHALARAAQGGRREEAFRRRLPSGAAAAAEEPGRPDLRPPSFGTAAAAYGSLAAMLQNNSMQDKAHGFVGAVHAAFVAGDGDAVEKKATLAAAKRGVAPEDALGGLVHPRVLARVVRGGGRRGARRGERWGTVTGGDLLTDACSTSVPFGTRGMVAALGRLSRNRWDQRRRAREKPGVRARLHRAQHGGG